MLYNHLYSSLDTGPSFKISPDLANKLAARWEKRFTGRWRKKQIPKPVLVLCIVQYLFLFCHTSWFVELPQPGIEPIPPAVEAQSLNHWTTREAHVQSLLQLYPSCPLGWHNNSGPSLRRDFSLYSNKAWTNSMAEAGPLFLTKYANRVHHCTYLNIVVQTNKDLLYSTCNSAQCYVAVWRGEELGGEWLYVYVRLSPFTVHLTLSQTLLIGYTPIQNKKFTYWKEIIPDGNKSRKRSKW